jgi:hypothetical protein
MLRAIARGRLHPTRLALVHAAQQSVTRRCTAMAGDPPTEKQLTYARSLAQRLGEELPEGVKDQRGPCEDFINEALIRVPPTAAQIQFAQQLAAEQGVQDLSEEVRTSAKACASYINRWKSKSGRYTPYTSTTMSGVPPTAKQILFAASLATQQEMGLSYEVLSDKAAMSRFISAMTEAPVHSPTADGATMDSSTTDSLVHEASENGSEKNDHGNNTVDAKAEKEIPF